MAPAPIPGHGSIPKELEDAFVKVSFEEITLERASGQQGSDEAYVGVIENASAQRSSTDLWMYQHLRSLYPKHSIVPSVNLSVLGMPGTIIRPASADQVIATAMFVPLSRRSTDRPGLIVEQVAYGAFDVAWEEYDFKLFIFRYTLPSSFLQTYSYFLHEGPSEPSLRLILAAGIWSQRLDHQVLVFNQGFWQKSAELWEEIQKADWADIIMKQEFKDILQKDVYGFFDSENVYKELGIPWKRGMIMWGPPGNGKTITIKAIMKACDKRGFAPLYVKSFQSYKGEEGAMQDVFDKARQMSPCVLIFEDLDALITDRNRSFFLNQLDGLQGNDGLLCIGTTNHFDRLDTGLSERPSRFDRKYLFDDPDLEERALYAKYWQKKLLDNKKVDFPDTLVDEVASSTEGFSFAYLKEAFVSTLVLLVTDPEHNKDFISTLKRTIKELRKQLEKKAGPAVGVISTSGAFTDAISAMIPKPENRALETAAALATKWGRRYF